MNCQPIREYLVELVYEDLAPEKASMVAEHVADCPACQREVSALKQLRQTLQAVPAPQAAVSLPRLYQEALDRATRRARRWRYATLAGLSVAAVLLLGLKLEVRIDSQQMVVRWGKSTTQTVPTYDPPQIGQPSVIPNALAPNDLAQAEEIQRLRSLIHAVAADVNDRDRQQQQDLRRLRARLDVLQRQEQTRWAATQDDVAALYSAQFGSHNKGAKR